MTAGWISACPLPDNPLTQEEAELDRRPIALAWTAGLPLLPEDKPRSIRYRQARLRWRTAEIAFDKQRYSEAAAAFFEVAEVLKSERPHPHASTFATARCLAYENAARALAALSDFAAARERLEAAVAGEEACPHAIRRAFESLEPPRDAL